MKENTAFMIGKGIYCYEEMSFGLKNAGATYQWLVNKVFKDQIEHSMEIYVNDMFIKRSKESNYIKDLEEAFVALHRN